MNKKYTTPNEKLVKNNTHFNQMYWLWKRAGVSENYPMQSLRVN